MLASKKDEKPSFIISGIFRKMLTVQILTMVTGIAGNLVDGMVTGKFLGETAMAAFGFTTTMSLIVAIVGSVLSTGTSAICGKSLGEGDIKVTRQIFSSCFSMTLLISIALAIVMIVFAIPFVRIAGAEGEVAKLAVDYIRGFAIACPGIIFVSFFLPIMQLDGEMNRLMIAVIIMTLGDVAFDLLNVSVFNGGMFGMALATAFSYYIALLCLLPYFLKKNGIFSKPSFLLDKKAVGAMFKSGSPTALTQLGRMMLTFILNLYLMYIGGSYAVAAHAVIMSLANLCMVPGTAISTTTQIITGLFCGEEDRIGIKRLIRTASKYNITVNGVGMILFLIFAKPIVNLFYNGQASGIDITVMGFAFYALSMIFYGFNVIFRSYCQGSGQTKKAYIITASESFVCPLITALILGSFFEIPAIWLCFAVGEAVTMIVMLIVFSTKNSHESGFAAVIPFPHSFGEHIEADFECTFTENKVSEAVKTSKEIGSFCLKHGADKRTAFLLSLTMEEVVGNVMEHGFSDGKNHSIELRVLKKSEGWILRVRDDCKLFDMKKYMEQFSDDDPLKNIGLKILIGLAGDITYLNTFNLNNLTIRL